MSLSLLFSTCFFTFITTVVTQNVALQNVPSTPKAPGTFSNGKPGLYAEPPQVSADGQPSIYGVRDVDLPFYRLYNGSLKFFQHTNDLSADNTTWGSKYDNANQSACGIPYNAWFISTVAIHPYFLKYAGLDRTYYFESSTVTKLTDFLRLLHARCLHLILGREWIFGHDVESDRYMFYRPK